MQPQYNDKLPSTGQNTPPPVDIFVEQVPEPKPVNKKNVGVTIVLTILGVVLLCGILLITLIGSANNLATDYKVRANKILASSQKQLKYIEPSEALNKRDLTSPLQVLSLDDTSQPQLPQVLFVGDMSVQYTGSKQLELQVATHYKSIDQYTKNLKKLIDFDDGMQVIFVEESALATSIKQDDANQIRSFAGTQLTYADRIKKLETASQLNDTRAQIAELYTQKAAAYQAWADALEKNDTPTVSTVRAAVASIEVGIQERMNDKRFITLMTPSYEKLVSEHKILLSRTSS